MSSEKQIEANRRNALKSTRPKSEKGKERASMNALRHGLTAEQAVLPHEDPRNYDQIRAGMLDAHTPANAPNSPSSKARVSGAFSASTASRTSTGKTWAAIQW